MQKVISLILSIAFLVSGFPSPALAASPLLTNLVSYWKMDDNSNDAVSSNNGSDTSMSYSATGAIINHAAQFNGSAKITVAHNSSLNLESIDSSISFWIRPTSVSGTQYIMWKGLYTALNSQWYVRLTSGKIQSAFSYNIDSAYDYYPCNTTLSVNTLYHIVITHNASTRVMKIYINGTEDGVTTLTSGGAPTTANTSALLFGVQNPTGLSDENFYSGSLDEAGIWTQRILSQSEVSQLYNGGAGNAYPFSVASIFIPFRFFRPF